MFSLKGFFRNILVSELGSIFEVCARSIVFIDHQFSRISLLTISRLITGTVESKKKI